MDALAQLGEDEGRDRRGCEQDHAGLNTERERRQLLRQRSDISSWSDDCAATGTATTCTVVMTAPRATVVTLDLDVVTVSLTIVGTGTVSDSAATFTCSSGTCMHDYLWGVALSFPKPSGNFAAWSGACSGGNACSLSASAMQTNKSLTATFIP